MDISSLHGVNAYTNLANTTPPVDNTQGQGRNSEASRPAPDSESTATAQKAFEVTISPEAQDRLAAAPTREPAETQTTVPEDQNSQNVEPNQETNRIVNIVA